MNFIFVLRAECVFKSVSALSQHSVSAFGSQLSARSEARDTHDDWVWPAYRDAAGAMTRLIPIKPRTNKIERTELTTRLPLHLFRPAWRKRPRGTYR